MSRHMLPADLSRFFYILLFSLMRPERTYAFENARARARYAPLYINLLLRGVDGYASTSRR